MNYNYTRFAKLSVRVIYAEDIRNYREDNSTGSFFARLHTDSLPWPGMDTLQGKWKGMSFLTLLVWFYE